MSEQALVVEVRKLDAESYAPYGNIIAAADDKSYSAANLNTAKRFNHLCELQNLRPEDAKLNLCVFRCRAWKEASFEFKLLEKHEYSTQVFLPMDKNGRYLVIVALGGEKPDLTTLSAFIASGPQGISYKPGIWHYPMTALDADIDFSCLVFENGSKADCQISQLIAPIRVMLQSE
ncbi:MAG: ureidoglycolate lyase [Candidatus Obscuribacterales bacterium]|nr:ureidoglycolate lyase [Candidatus Obscuribacterales bacterium]